MGVRRGTLEDLVVMTGSQTRPSPLFWQGRRVLLTGHTGFKGSWLALMLHELGAEVHGFALPADAGPTAYAALRVSKCLATDGIGDLRDSEALAQAVRRSRADLVFHLAAQALVGRALRDPCSTLQTNVGGTVNLLEALHRRDSATTAIIVTSDKVYRPGVAGQRHRETDPLGGQDPYSASKAACEHVVTAYRAAAAPGHLNLATARAGNVIGGGDFAEDRLIPDIVRAECSGEPVRLRRPQATRPFQHVIDVLLGYVLLAERLAEGHRIEALNFGPVEGELSVAEMIVAAGTAIGRPLRTEELAAPPFAESTHLALDSDLAAQLLGWRPRRTIREAVEDTFHWYRAWWDKQDTAALAREQVAKALS